MDTLSALLALCTGDYHRDGLYPPVTIHMFTCTYDLLDMNSNKIPNKLLPTTPTLIAKFMGPTWGPPGRRQDPGGPHVDRVTFVVWEYNISFLVLVMYIMREYLRYLSGVSRQYP